MFMRSLTVIMKQSLGRSRCWQTPPPSPARGRSTWMLQRGTGTSAGHHRGLLVVTSGDLNWPPAGTFSWPWTGRVEQMPAPRKYPPELRARAIRLVHEAREQEPGLSLNAAVQRIAPRVGVVPDTLRGWVKQRRIDDGEAPGLSTQDKARIGELERENRELKRANEILLAASSFFARELDPRLPW